MSLFSLAFSIKFEVTTLLEKNKTPFQSICEYHETICDYLQTQLDILIEYLPEYHTSNEINESPTKKIPAFPISKEQRLLLQKKLISFAIRCKKSQENGLVLPLYSLIQRLKLSQLEVHFMMTTLAWEFFPSFADGIKKIQKNQDTTPPTIQTTLLLYRTHSAFIIDEGFWGKIKNLYFLFFESDEHPNWYKPIRLNNVALAYFIGQDSTYPYYLSLYLPNMKTIPLSYNPIKEDIMTIYSKTSSSTILVLTGVSGCGKKTILKKTANDLKKSLIFINSSLFCFLSQQDWDNGCLFILRESSLKDAILCFYNFPNLSELDAQRKGKLIGFMKQIHSLQLRIFCTSNQKEWSDLEDNFSIIQIEVGSPSYKEQVALWEYYLERVSLSQSVSLKELTSKFVLTPKQIARACYEAKISKNQHPITSSLLHTCCYHQSLQNLTNNAQRVQPAFTWDDLILPYELKQQIQHSCNHIKLKSMVYDTWHFSEKFSYGNGVSILFAGPPGTGKTMLSQIIAHELGMELYRIDLSAIVSKYIGETEKNLEKIFDAAKNSSIILFFDEMDALFGKRSEAQDAHDKYANMEVAYLLQKIEAYNGLILMATNYLNNIDEAFIRRIQFIFSIPFPTEENRKLLWKQAFPKEAPIAKNIDFSFLAKNFEITGAVIKNISLSSAFMAGAEQKPISMKHILQATHIELAKQGKILIKEDFGEYSFYLEGEGFYGTSILKRKQ